MLERSASGWALGVHAVDEGSTRGVGDVGNGDARSGMGSAVTAELVAAVVSFAAFAKKDVMLFLGMAAAWRSNFWWLPLAT